MRTKAEFEEYVFHKAAIAEEKRKKAVKKQVISFSGVAAAAAVCLIIGFNMFSADDIPVSDPPANNVENIDNSDDLNAMSDTASANSFYSNDMLGDFEPSFAQSQQNDSLTGSSRKPPNSGASSSAYSSTTTANDSSTGDNEVISGDNDRNDASSKNSSKNSQASSSRPNSSPSSRPNSSPQSSNSSSSNPSGPHSQPESAPSRLPSTDSDTVSGSSSATGNSSSDVVSDPHNSQVLASDAESGGDTDYSTDTDPEFAPDWDVDTAEPPDANVYYGMTFHRDDINTITISDGSGNTHDEVYYDWYRIQMVCDELNNLVRYDALNGIDISAAEESYKIIKVEFYGGNEIIWYVNGDYYHDENWQNVFVPKT